jgi:hypothetical protein
MSSKSVGVKRYVDRIRRFIKAERSMREQVFPASGGMDQRKRRQAKLLDCDEALAALDMIEQVFIPRVTQEELL